MVNRLAWVRTWFWVRDHGQLDSSPGSLSATCWLSVVPALGCSLHSCLDTGRRASSGPDLLWHQPKGVKGWWLLWTARVSLDCYVFLTFTVYVFQLTIIISLKSLETSMPWVIQAMTLCKVWRYCSGSFWTSGLWSKPLHQSNNSWINFTTTSNIARLTSVLLRQLCHTPPFANAPLQQVNSIIYIANSLPYPVPFILFSFRW